MTCPGQEASMDVPSRGVERERERNSLAPPTLDIYLPLSNLSLYDAARNATGATVTFVLVGHREIECVAPDFPGSVV